MDKKEDRDSLAELSKSIDKLKIETTKPVKEKRDDSALFQKFSDLLAGIFVGIIIGYYLDRYFDKSPIFLVLCLIMGIAGGALNIYKSSIKDRD